MNLLITGGAGFIGSNLIRRIIDRPEITRLINLDCPTYAASLDNLAGIESNPRYVFERIDLRDADAVADVVRRHGVTHVIHLAAETHVDRSIAGPCDFIHTNIIGTFNLLEACRHAWSVSSPSAQSAKSADGGSVDGGWLMVDGAAASPHPSSINDQPSAAPGSVPSGEFAPYPASTSSAQSVQSAKSADLTPSVPSADRRFLHVSTDEVYGSLAPGEPAFTEDSPLKPNSPYAASKAAADHLVRSCVETYRLPAVITRCSNNFGPRQHAEKLIPTVIRCLRDREPIPLYGDGLNVRDWLHVDDHCDALWAILTRGREGEIYNIGSQNERPNLKLVQTLCDLVDELKPDLGGSSRSLISFVDDRPGHDRRYAINASKLQRELAWSARQPFEEGLRETVRWYLEEER